MIKRPLGCVLFIICIVIAFSVCGPSDYLGVYSKVKDFDRLALDGTCCTVSGQVYHKEIKKEQPIYYLRNATVLFENAYGKSIKFSSISIIYEFQKDDIPLYSQVKSKGKIKIFSEAVNEGNFDEKSYYNSLGLFCYIKNEADVEVLPAWFNKNDYLYKLKSRLGNVYDLVLPGEESGVVRAIALGEKSMLDQAVKEAFSAIGIAHILAISGLHVSLVGMGIYKLLRRAGIGFFSAGISSSSILILYGLMVGLTASSTRAIGMFLLIIMADILGEAYDMTTALAILAFTLLLSNPLYIKNAGFIFSFGAILGIIYIAGPIQKIYLNIIEEIVDRKVEIKGIDYKYEAGIIRSKMVSLGQSFAFSVGITLFTLPLTAFYYYEVPSLSIFLNVMLLPLMPFLLGFGLVGGLVGLFFKTPAQLILYPCHIIIYFYEKVAIKLSGFSHSRIICGCPSKIRLCLYFIILFLGVRIAIECGQIKNKIFLMIGTTILLMLVLFIPHKQDFSIRVLDVGQGDATIIQSDEGINFFIDGGSTDVSGVGEYRILPTLKYRGIKKIDYWFVTHSDEDHISGLIEILEKGYRIDNLILSKNIVKNENTDNLVLLAKAHKTKVCYMEQGQICGTDSIKFTCIFPEEEYYIDDPNAMSLCLLIEYDENSDGVYDFTGLFTGDMGQEQELLALENMKNISTVDYLKVAHHGSKNSSSPDLIMALRPKLATISCGKRNRYGHPHKETIDILSEAGVKTFRTDEVHEIIITESNCIPVVHTIK